MQGAELSPAMLLSIAQAQPWCRADGDTIVKSEQFQLENEDSHERRLVDLIEQHGPIVDSRWLLPLAEQAGISEVHFQTLLSSSPLIVRHGRALYGLVGSSPGEPSAIEAVEDMATSEGARSSDSSKLYCLNFFEDIVSRAHRVASACIWSTVEVIESLQDRERLRAWGRNGLDDVKLLRSQTVEYNDERLPGTHALALLFLAYSAEIVRTEGCEGEMWLLIRNSLRKDLAAEFFFENGLSKPWLREATELVCRRLRIRHAFGREGEQGWLRTVYLQFGMTKAGCKRLPYWLSGYSMPVAVEALLDQKQEIFSPSFYSLWRVLYEYRNGGLSEREATKKLIANAWAGPQFTPDLLQFAMQERQLPLASERGENGDGAAAATRSLFKRPRLLWTDEAKFELSLSDPLRTWLGEDQYSGTTRCTRSA